MRPTIACLALVALAACVSAPDPAPTVPAAAPVDPAAAAFARYDARVGLPDARIGRDDAGCALYTATGPDGQPYMEAMLTPEGESICTT